MTNKQLERAAIRAHRRRLSWSEFWQQNWQAIRAAERYDVRRYHKLVGRLSHLLTCGDTDGMTPIVNTWNVPAPWELDDATDLSLPAGEARGV